MSSSYWASKPTRPTDWPTPADMQAAASEYAALGLWVAPTTRIQGKGWYRECFTTRRQNSCGLCWEHPSEGFADKASRDPDQFQAWWPDSWDHETGRRLGIATGRESGIVGLEVIEHDGGIESLEAIEKRHVPLPETAVVASSSGDRRFLFRLPAGTSPSIPRVVARGIYVLFDEGLVYAPPSVSVRSAPAWLWTPAQGLSLAPGWVIPPARLPALPPGPVPTGPALEAAVSAALKAAAAHAPVPVYAPQGPTKSSRFGLAALGGEIFRLGRSRSAAKVMQAAKRLWRAIDRGALTLCDLRSGLLAAGRRAGLPDHVTLKAIQDGLAAGVRPPRRRLR